MKKLSAVILGLILCAFLLAGCGIGGQKEEETSAEIENDAAVFGTWKEDYFDSGYVFNEDGTGTEIFWELPFTYTAHDGIITITYDDTTYGIDRYEYSVSDSQISMTRQTDDKKSFTYTKK